MNKFLLWSCSAIALGMAPVVFSQEAKVLTKLAFKDGVMKQEGWTFGSQGGGNLKWSPDDRLGSAGDGSLHATYPSTKDRSGGIFVWAGFDVKKYNTYELYIEFWSKAQKVQGLKFLKIFGQIDPVNKGMANATFGLVYADPKEVGTMAQVAFGSGYTPQNDMQSIVDLKGVYPDWVGRSYAKGAVVETPQRSVFKFEENKWHKFRIMAKFNSVDPETGEEIPDGAFYVEIDDKIYADARGLFNRHPSNLPIQNINFFDWSQQAQHSFDIWIDDVVVSTGGFPKAPKAPEATIE